MKLFVILLCLCSERFLMHSISYKRFSWFNDYCQKIMTSFGKNNSWFLLFLLIIPVVALVSLMYVATYKIAFGFFGLILNILIFLYCIGPANPFYPVVEAHSKESISAAGTYFAAVNKQLFSVIFWYILAGPIAALTYRLIDLCRGVSPVHTEAQKLADVLEWVPARLTSLLYLLVGNFQRGVSSFLHFIGAKPELNKPMLSECGLKAVCSNESEEIPMTIAVSLVEHATIVLLVLIALCTLVAWL